MKQGVVEVASRDKTLKTQIPLENVMEEIKQYLYDFIPCQRDNIDADKFDRIKHDMELWQIDDDNSRPAARSTE